MTVSNTNNKVIYVGNGALLVFPYTYRIFEDSDLEVTIQDTSVSPQTDLLLVLNQDYTVSDAGNPAGGNVTLILGGSSQLTTAPIATDDITLQRVLPITQETDYVENDDFPAESHEDALDRGTMVDQQLSEIIGRSLVIPVNITGVSTELPSPEALAILGWNAAGDAITNYASIDYRVAVDDAAAPGTLGATAGDGVLRTDASIGVADGGDFITLSVAVGGVDHDSLLNYVANEHIDHTAVNIDTTAPLAGGGDISATRTLTLDIDAATAATVASGDLVVIADVDDSNNPKKVTAQSIADLSGGTSVFTGLTDTPANYTGETLKAVRVNAGETALEFYTPAAATAFVGLSDTPANYTGASLQPVRVNTGETALEYYTPATSSDSVIEEISQATHGFSVGDWVYHNGTIFALSDASAAATIDSHVGVVSVVPDVNNFTLQTAGRVTGLTGLTAGSLHYISETAGAITTTAPVAVGAIVKPVLIGDSTTTGYIVNQLGVENVAVSGGGSWTLVNTLTFANSAVQGTNVSGTKPIKLVFDNLRSVSASVSTVGIRIGLPAEYTAGAAGTWGIWQSISNAVISNTGGSSYILVASGITNKDVITGQVYADPTRNTSSCIWPFSVNVQAGQPNNASIAVGTRGGFNESGIVGVSYTGIYVRAVAGANLNGKVHVYESAN